MIATCFPRNDAWGWEVLAVDGSVVAAGDSRTPLEARRAGVDVYVRERLAGRATDLGTARTVRFGGAHAR